MNRKDSLEKPSLQENGDVKPTLKEKLGIYIVKLRHMMVDPNESDLTKSISISVGVFISIVPLWGLQTLTAIGAAFLFRLNKPLVIAASYLSVPPILGLILVMSMGLGTFFVDKAVHITLANANMDLVTAALHQYIIGSLALALIAAPLFGLLTYGFLKVVVRRKS